MSDWFVALVLPNVTLTKPIETGPIALVPQEDDRLKSIKRRHTNVRAFLSRFSDSFDVRIRPSVILVRADAPAPVLRIDAVAAFRDAIVASVIPYNRALQAIYPNRRGVLYSDSFWIHPWSLTKDYENVQASTVGYLALHSVDKFKGQAAPELPAINLDSNDVDAILLEALLDRWRRRFSSGRRSRKDTVLFRSLNMANFASRMPAGREATLYDFGRSVALWVSAFEILSHPGSSGSGIHSVYQLLRSVKWVERDNSKGRYLAHKIKARREVLAVWLYGEIYKRRNAFIHGNDITEKALHIPRSGRVFYWYTAPLYRLALSTYLDLFWKKPAPAATENMERLGKYIAEQSSFQWVQGIYERCLMTARRRNPDEK